MFKVAQAKGCLRYFLQPLTTIAARKSKFFELCGLRQTFHLAMTIFSGCYRIIYFGVRICCQILAVEWFRSTAVMFGELLTGHHFVVLTMINSSSTRHV